MFKANCSKTQRTFAGKIDKAIIIGGAPSFKTHDLTLLEGIPTIGCNCILQHEWFRPRYLLISDRRPYITELGEGRLASNAKTVKYLLSTTLFDPHIVCGGMPVQRPPKFRWWPWRVGVSRTPFNWETFERPLCSFATTAGQMLQAAAIMGAKNIGMIGIDMQMPKDGKMHWHRQAVDMRHATIQKDGTLGSPATMQLFAKARDVLGMMGIKVHNLSPVKNSAMARVFGSESYERFCKTT